MFGFGKKKVHLQRPCAGQVVPITDVPDPVFSQGIVGEGFAVVPETTTGIFQVCAPANGTIVSIFPTLHAFAMKTEQGLELLVHVGLDTVSLQGQGFTSMVARGDTVSAGDVILRVDASVLTDHGCSLITPVVATNKKQVSSLALQPTNDIVCTVTLA